MNESILKLAKECRGYEDGVGDIVLRNQSIEAFYRAAYNKAIEDAISACNHVCDRARPSLKSGAYQQGAIDCAEQVESWRMK